MATASPPDVLVLSRIVLDEFEDSSGLPTRVLGGSGFWAAVGAALAGASVSIATKVGRGFGPFMDDLHDLGIGTDAIEVTSAPPSVTRITYPEPERRHEEPWPSWQAHVAMRAMLPEVPEPARSARAYYVFRDLHPGFFPPVLEAAAESGAPVLWEIPGVVCAGDLTDELAQVLRRIDILSINQAEARDLVGPHSLDATADALLALGPRVVVLRLGSRGSLVTTWNERHRFESAAATVRDVTGAGNAYSGAFLARYAASEGDLVESAVVATAAAGTVTERVGPPIDLPTGSGRCSVLAGTVSHQAHRSPRNHP